jgi:Pectate lyase superfamily protein
MAKQQYVLIDGQWEPVGGPAGPAGGGSGSHSHSLGDLPATLATDSEVETAIAAHEVKSDPHPVYLTPSEVVAGANITVDTLTTPGSVIVIGQSGSVDRLNAKDAPYSAKGDGTTDDTSALQACINDAAAQGKIAYLPKGTYRVQLASRDVGNGVMEDCGLYLPSNTRLIGDGPGPRTFKSQDTGTVFGWSSVAEAGTKAAEFTGVTQIHTTSTGAGSVIASINPRRVSIERMSVYGLSKTGPSALHGIKFGYTTDTVDPKMNSVPFYINCDDVWVSNCKGDGFRNQTTCVSSFRNCVASEIGGTAFNHPEGSTSCTYISCWARGGTVGWHFQGSTYCNLSGCAADYCNTSYWVSDSQTIGFFGCGSEFPIDLTPGGPVTGPDRGYSWIFDGGSNTCTVVSGEIIGNPYRAVWITGGANGNTFIGLADNGPTGTAQNCFVLDAGTAATAINARLGKVNLIDPAAAFINMDEAGSIKAPNLFVTSANATAMTLPYFNGNKAVISTKMIYDDTPAGGSITAGEVHVAGATALTLPFFNANKALLSSKVAYDDAGTGSLTVGSAFVTEAPSVPTQVVNKAYADGLVVGGGGGLDQATADGRYVNITGDTVTGPMIANNASQLVTPVTINRTATSTSTSDADTFVVNYLTERATWTNEKGNLRTSNKGAKGEVAFKIIGAATAEGGTGNMLEVLDIAGNVQARIGPLGRMNFNKGIRMVGDTIEVQDSTGADSSTISQPLGGSLTIAPKTSLSLSNKKIVSLADGVAATDAAAFGQVSVKANTISPALTGTPTAPTATAGTNTTQIATTAYVVARTPTIIAGLTAPTDLTAIWIDTT